MLTAYIRAAMHQAIYEILEDGSYYGEVAVLPGVYANARTLEECREELQSVLEEWIVLGLRLGHALPPVGGIQLDVAAEMS
jgi:predicted RNase H-like HicB family nuclease